MADNRMANDDQEMLKCSLRNCPAQSIWFSLGELLDHLLHGIAELVQQEATSGRYEVLDRETVDNICLDKDSASDYSRFTFEQVVLFPKAKM